jgi:2,3-bisphosphoglycerate-independent phosphoglycerate mutase
LPIAAEFYRNDRDGFIGILIVNDIKQLALIILDGWGSAPSWGGNAASVANIPNFNKALRENPQTLIAAAGQSVGLPGNEVGNSEVGHMNLGAGQIVSQDINNINRSINDGSFYKNETLISAIRSAREKDKAIHLIGIVSDGGIHSHIIHLIALLKLCKEQEARKVYIQAIMDGRDTDQMKGEEFITTLNRATKSLGLGTVSSVSGRIYLDRKGDWSKTETLYKALCEGIGTPEKSALSAIANAYRRGETDEYIRPAIIDGTEGTIKDGDTVIFYNFRSDRTRQLTKALLAPDFSEFKRKKINDLNFISFIPYGAEREIGVAVKTAFPATRIDNCLAKFICENNLKQFHIAETEKYAHVTYFFNGNIEDPYRGEERVIIPSPQVKNYADSPEMSAEEIKNNFLKHIKSGDFAFTICNFANPDMVGHSGNFEAVVKALEFLDLMLKDIFRVCADRDISLVVTADHGNAEQMVDPATGAPDPEHTKNPVPFIVLSSDKSIKLKAGGKLANVAETCLNLMSISSNNLFLNSLIENSN